ncbi:Oxidase ustYa [Colletotrichum sp. SAR 10_70]|nr:Oxidase ustYa [Colletotrichum sp. SAR 10_71]KAI8159456.1 Oxidase ustYa [Colletotrichum sp. SAR 10_70]KAI8225867.1 Oxidase ustYa [Colletotrichum sp. SAR 10_86]KAI8256161.1 Oxidase ustYa [Colletotrichum sp. SAR 10_77]KAJ5000437.1 Oxidase ustYa [Colletotrichum sp. SAR 10_66]
MNHGYSDTRRGVSPHNDSMTDISVSLLSEDDKPWKQADIEDGSGCATRRSRCAKKCEAFRRWRWVLDTALILVVVGLLVERRYLQSPARDKRLEPVGDLTGFAPEFTQQITTFHPTTDFVPDDPKSLFTNASLQENWLKMVPRGLGYLEVKNPRAHSNLPVPLPEFAPRTVFTTSMTHQLHCLYAILESYAGLSVNGSAAVDMHSHIPEGTEGADGPWHLQHCFEYLRQAILCSGDVALEGTQTTFPPGFTGSDGWDAKHVCKDPKQVYEYLDKNRALDDHWI